MKNLDTKRIADLHLQLAKEFDAARPDPLPDPIPVPDPPSPATMLVRVFFYGTNHSFKTPVDMKINGKWYNFSQNMVPTIGINQAIGTVFSMNEKIRTIELRESQIRFAGLNQDGFGYTNIKYGAVPAEDNFEQITEEKWSSWVFGKANHTARWGDLSGKFDNKDFYKIVVPDSYNDSGRFAIYVSGHGENKR